MGTKNEACRCAVCRRLFVPDRYNAWHQDCCPNPECVRIQRRKRKREWLAARKAADEAFAEKERTRCREAKRQSRALLAAAVDSPPAPPRPPLLPVDAGHVLLGLVAQTADTLDGGQLRPVLAAYADRGRLVAASGLLLASSP